MILFERVDVLIVGEAIVVRVEIERVSLVMIVNVVWIVLVV